MISRTKKFRVIRQPRELAGLSGQKIAIYWPHGFGDFIFLSYILPFLNPTNQYYIVGLGDMYASVFEGSRYATPLYIGTNDLRRASGAGKRPEHFGLRDFQEPHGDIVLPQALADQCEQLGIHVIADIGFWEIYGKREYPWHTKARNTLEKLVGPSEREDVSAKLRSPLLSGIDFSAPDLLRRIVESRLRSVLNTRGRKLCVISRNGYTNCDKNWGHLWRDEDPERRMREGDECRDFIRLLRSKDSRWSFLVMEDRMFSGHDTVRDPDLCCASYAEIFGGLDSGGFPFAIIAKILVTLADLVVGVPTGPFHLACAHPNVPAIGIWTNFFPSWWDEPRLGVRHVVGRHVRESGRANLPGSFTMRDGLRFHARELVTKNIPGSAVLEEVESLGI